MSSTSVVIVEDHRMFSDGLSLLLETRRDLRIRATVRTFAEADRYFAEQSADVALVDLRLPDGNGLDLIRAHKPSGRMGAAVVLSVHSDPRHIREAFAAGADAYLSKTTAAGSLLEAIAVTSRGELYADGVTTRVLLENLGVRAGVNRDNDGLAQLTPRERDVFIAIANGFSTKEVARRLELSPKTVETYRAGIYRKLGVASPVDIARYAADQGLI